MALHATRAQGRGGIAAGIAPDEGGNQHAIRYAISAGEGSQQGSHRGARWPYTPHHTRREQQRTRRAVQMHAVHLHVERLVFGLSSSRTRRSSCRWQPCKVAASGTCRWQPPQGGQSVSQSVSRGKPPTYADARTSPKVAAGSPQIPSGSPVAQLFECRAKKWQGPQSSAYECERSVSP